VEQIFLLFGGTMLMGFIFGMMFGIMDVEDDNSAHPKLRQTLIYSLILGSVLGLLLGAANELMRLFSTGAAQYSALAESDVPKPIAAPTGYDDI
jgi:prolipoprotein diacylglyceryltransferase